MLAPADLTIPEPGSTTARDVLSRAIRRALDDLRHLPEAHAASEAGRAEYRAFRRVLARLLREDAGAVASLLRHPTVAVFVRCLRDRDPGEETDRWLGELVASALLELAAGGALPEDVRVTRLPAELLCLPTRLRLRVPAGTRAATFRAGSVTLHGEGGDRQVALDGDAPELDRPYHEIEGGVVLARADNNPLSMLEAHPDKLGNAIDLGGKSAEDWVAALREAFGLIEAHLPDLHRELLLYIQQIVPVGFDEQAHLSASYLEDIGTIYLTLHPQPMTMAEAVIHELSHNKLNALLELEPLLDNAFSPLYRSPVRPDPRPLHGVLLAVHAFLPVARLYERMTEAGHPWARSPDFQRRRREVEAKNREGAGVLLEHGQPTPAGRAVLDEIARWDAHFQGRGG